MLKALLKAFSFGLGVLMALPLLMMFVGVMMALVGSILGATSAADIGKGLAGAGAISFVFALYVGGKLAPLKGFGSGSKTRSGLDAYPAYRAQQVRSNPAAYGAGERQDSPDASTARRKWLGEELAKRRIARNE